MRVNATEERGIWAQRRTGKRAFEKWKGEVVVKDLRAMELDDERAVMCRNKVGEKRGMLIETCSSDSCKFKRFPTDMLSSPKRGTSL